MNGEAMEQGRLRHIPRGPHRRSLGPRPTPRRSGSSATSARGVATPAQLIQLSRGLQVNVSSVVKNIVNLASGEASIAFDEQHTDGDGQPLKVPGIFMLSIAPFFMG